MAQGGFERGKSPGAPREGGVIGVPLGAGSTEGANPQIRGAAQSPASRRELVLNPSQTLPSPLSHENVTPAATSNDHTNPDAEPLARRLSRMGLSGNIQVIDDPLRYLTPERTRAGPEETKLPWLEGGPK